MKDDEWNFEGPEVYNDGRIRIHQARAPDEYDVLINGRYIF